MLNVGLHIADSQQHLNGFLSMQNCVVAGLFMFQEGHKK